MALFSKHQIQKHRKTQIHVKILNVDILKSFRKFSIFQYCINRLVQNLILRRWNNYNSIVHVETERKNLINALIEFLPKKILK